MARDRQRAKQRKARRAGQNPGPARSEPHRTNVPGELEHASGEADEFDAALVAGAGASGRDMAPPDDDAVPADDSADATEDEELVEDALEADPAATGEIYDDELEDLGEEDDAEVAAGGGGVATRRGRSGAESAAAPSRGLFARFAAFLRASWAELQRVQWPDRRQVAQATAVVLGFVVVAGLYLGVADRVAQEVVDLII